MFPFILGTSGDMPAEHETLLMCKWPACRQSRGLLLKWSAHNIFFHCNIHLTAHDTERWLTRPLPPYRGTPRIQIRHAKPGMNDVQSSDPKSASEVFFFLASGESRVFLHSSFPSPLPS